MANTKSADKRHRQNVESRDRNRAQRSRMRTAVAYTALAYRSSSHSIPASALFGVHAALLLP